MAVPPQPSHRLGARKSSGLRSTAAINDTEDQLSSRRSKRTRDTSLANDGHDSNKKPRSEFFPHKFRKGIQVPKRTTFKALPIRSRKTVQRNLVTQVPKARKPDPVLVPPPQVNGDSTNPSPPHGQKLPFTNGINQNVSPPTGPHADKRSLRSHDGTSRFKSDLEQYFSNYEELIDIAPKPPDIITPTTLVRIIEEPKTQSPPRPKRRGRPRSSNFSKKPRESCPHIIQWPDEMFTNLTNVERVPLPPLDARQRKIQEDPLDDDVFLRAHAKEERKEKQLRNIEKERAMHEKFQLECLLEGLRSHDWLRTMGISGITEGEKKAYEPKRDHLISEVRVLLEKFRIWKEDEKRRKVEKDDSVKEESNADDEHEEVAFSEDDEDVEVEDGKGDSEIEEDADIDEEIGETSSRSTGRSTRSSGRGNDSDEEARSTSTRAVNGLGFSSHNTPTKTSPRSSNSEAFSDVDASAARQLQMEAVLASQLQRGAGRKGTARLGRPGTRPMIVRGGLAFRPLQSFYRRSNARGISPVKRRVAPASRGSLKRAVGSKASKAGAKPRGALKVMTESTTKLNGATRGTRNSSRKS